MTLTLHTAFGATSTEADSIAYSLRRERIGTLRTRGRIGACDPLTSSRVEPYGLSVAAGSYPVDLLLASHDKDTRVALARVVFREGQPARFDLALKPGQDIRTLRADERFGYGVDAGTGCFADADVAPDGDAILSLFETRRVNTWSWAVTNDDRCVSFSSGYGDGVYSSYVGVDEAGAPMCLVTDFGVIDVDLPQHATDDSFRVAEAERLAQLVFDRLSWLGGEKHGEVWMTVSELGEMREAGRTVLPRLVDALVKTDSDLEEDLLAHAVGKLLVGDEALAIFEGALSRFTDANLGAVLRKWRHDAQEKALASLVDALAMRWDTASDELRGHLLSAIEHTTRRSLHPSFARFAEETVAAALANDAGDFAVRRAAEALEPYRQTAWREDRARVPQNPAPDSLLAMLPKLLALATEDDVRRYCFDVLALNGRTDLVVAVLDDAKNPARLTAAIALYRDASLKDRTRAVFREIAADATRGEEDRFTAVSRLDDAHERCAGLLALGMTGFIAAPVQLQYLASEAHDAALAALEKLAKEAPDAKVRKQAAKVRKRIS